MITTHKPYPLELEPHWIDFEALRAMNFQTICENTCPGACTCVRAAYFDGATRETSHVVIEQSHDTFLLIHSPLTEPGYYVIASGDAPDPAAPVRCRPGRAPRTHITKGQRFIEVETYSLPEHLRSKGG